MTLLTEPVLRDGSSPRTWGTAAFRPGTARFWRFIPTYVGNRRNEKARTGRRAVHPHVRGEQSSARLSRRLRCGSSPRTWGTATSAWLARRNWRFIPTYVGNSFRARACALSGDGSSPRTWGTATARSARSLPRRFIPTYVGNRALSQGERGSIPVHPHVRGEQPVAVPEYQRHPGSSPRTWGTVVVVNRALDGRRFIPTYVGNRHH